MEKYEPISFIGKGNFGSITKIKRIIDGKILVWKELNYGVMSEKERNRIVQEVNILHELHHPNIVKYYDRIIDKKNTKLYIVMEYCPRGDLSQLIKRNRKSNQFFSEDIIWKIFSQVSSALYACHTHKEGKILHRDIKPSNIFIDQENNIKLGDFGLSRILNQDISFAVSRVGTPYYMSPEQIENIKYNEKSDIWSLGCCIYEMCNLKHAFEGQFFPAVSVKISEGKRLPVNKIYSKELRNIIDYMLDLNMRNRPTIAFLLEKTFVRKYVGEYIIDFVNNYRKYEANEEQINILKEQAEKFKIFKVKLNQDNLNGYNINSDNNYNNKTKEDIIYTDKNDEIKNAERNKRIKLDKKYLNKNEKKEFLKTNDNLFEEKKSLLLLDQSPKNKNKKLQINNFIFDNKIIQKQQNTINYNNYNETDYINSNNLGKKKNRKLIKYKENHRQKILTDKSKSNIIDDDSNITNKSYTKNIYEKKLNDITNEKKFIIYKRINYFKEKTIKALGTNFYNKAYNYLKNARNNNGLVNNDIKREYLSNTFGKNNIGYWQLIDQILFLENILETF